MCRVLLQRGKKTRWEEIQPPNGEEIGEADVGEYKISRRFRS